MGKKAVNLLLHAVLIFFTFIICGVTALAMWGSTLSPYESGAIALLALSLPGLLFVNVLLLFYWIFRRRLWVIFPMIALGVNYKYYPRIFQWSDKDKPVVTESSKTVRIATYNINYFAYYDVYRLTVNEIANFVRSNDIDIICFQEYAENESFTVDSMKLALDMPYWTYAENSVEYKDVAIFSRYPLGPGHTLRFANSPSTALWTDIDIEGVKVRLMTAHMQTTSINLEKDDLERQMALGSTTDQARAAIRISNFMKHNFRRRTYQAEQIKAVMDTTSLPLIFCADSNDTPSSYVYTLLTDNGKRVDSFIEAGKGYGYTYKNMRKLLRIDYILHTPDLQVAEYNSPDLRWSDHKPVFVEMILNPEL